MREKDWVRKSIREEEKNRKGTGEQKRKNRRGRIEEYNI